MLANFVGSVDVNAAFVLVAIAFCVCVVVTSLIIKRRSSVDISNEFELAKMKQSAEAAQALFSLETSRSYKFKQIESGLITSHSCTD